MRKLALAASTAALLLCGVSAADAATFISAPTPAAADGSTSRTFGNNGGIAAGMFTDTFTFNWADDGVTAGTISSSFTSPTNDLNFTSVTLNGVEFDFLSGGPGRTEFREISLATMAGLQTLVVKGVSPGTAATYSGTLTFTPGLTGAIPEASTWALMILGFGGAGAMLRRRNAVLATAA